MDRKRKNYRQGRHEGNRDHYPYKDGYHGRDPYQDGDYDNGSYVPDGYWQGAGIRYPSTYRAPYVKEPPYGVFRPSSSIASTDSDLRTPSRKRRSKYMIIAIILTVVLVAAIVGAILAATLPLGSEEAAQPKTVERIGKYTFVSSY
ncbi:uncharacterized protein LOC128557997 [Mercenaria mercenaria]|uniref:uncharacterized protein LOC128557997 n=1 Tax=Mercenaria mercenaria TaxID=6596 RepID=UPI00234F73C6|nr:uncharacterized protein LOC128557997 [Mercenaria mercenaria]